MLPAHSPQFKAHTRVTAVFQRTVRTPLGPKNVVYDRLRKNNTREWKCGSLHEHGKQSQRRGHQGRQGGSWLAFFFFTGNMRAKRDPRPQPSDNASDAFT